MTHPQDPFSALLYPMLTAQPSMLASTVAELARAPLEKSAESNALRHHLLEAQGDDIIVAARRIAREVFAGGRLLACGNGGSATLAADLVAEAMNPDGDAPAVPGLCLTGDVSVVTAVANDVSFDDVFLRQLIALSRPHDVVVLVSTSGNSENLLRAASCAQQRGLLTVGIAGYDGGRLAKEYRLDHCFVVRSSSVHRIQEVQTTLCHLLLHRIQTSLRETAACA